MGFVIKVENNWRDRGSQVVRCNWLLSTIWGKKTAPFYFCNSCVRTSSIKTIFGTHILQYIFYHHCILYSLYNQRRGTSL